MKMPGIYQGFRYYYYLIVNTVCKENMLTKTNFNNSTSVLSTSILVFFGAVFSFLLRKHKISAIVVFLGRGWGVWGRNINYYFYCVFSCPVETFCYMLIINLMTPLFFSWIVWGLLPYLGVSLKCCLWTFFCKDPRK